MQIVTSLALAVSLLCKHIAGHGYLYVPPSRNYVAYLAGRDYNKNELNGKYHLSLDMHQMQLTSPRLMNHYYCMCAAGGPGTVYSGGLRWPNGKHGICGGAWPSDADKYMQVRPNSMLLDSAAHHV